MQLVENFYVAKINERELAKQAQLHAIYETGARITHDIKNLLQSMHSMIAIIQADSDSKDPKSLVILKKQFPYFIQRLELAMNKLQTPEQSSQEQVYFRDWWRELQSFHKELDIKFVSDLKDDPLIPVELFESIVENLLENATTKKREEHDINITVNAIAADDKISLMVLDTGKAIDDKTSSLLFKEPLASTNGLGIGLLQASKQAESYGYSLILKNNTDGNVCFELKKSGQGT
jgi:K+-sensing histidine kinase KdpD